MEIELLLTRFATERQRRELKIDSSLFFAYLLYLQSGYFLRPAHLSPDELLDGLRHFDAPQTLIEHYDEETSVEHRRGKFFEFALLVGLFLSTVVFSLDLYRQLLILVQSPDQERSLPLTLLVYLVDGLLIVLICSQRITLAERWKSNRVTLSIDLLSALGNCRGAESGEEKTISVSVGILLYFLVQRPVTHLVVSRWNLLWIFIHLCRSSRLAQLGLHLAEIRWCLQALTHSLRTYGQTLLALAWFFIFSAAFLFAVDRLEGNQQYPTMFSAILSAHETLYAIGYRNNAPHGRWTRLWTLISIFGLSSLVQMFLWCFQRRVTGEWKRIVSTQSSANYEQVDTRAQMEIECSFREKERNLSANHHCCM